MEKIGKAKSFSQEYADSKSPYPFSEWLANKLTEAKAEIKIINSDRLRFSELCQKLEAENKKLPGYKKG